MGYHTVRTELQKGVEWGTVTLTRTMAKNCNLPGAFLSKVMCTCLMNLFVLDAISEQHIIKRLNLKTKMSITIFITHRYLGLHWRISFWIKVWRISRIRFPSGTAESWKYYSELLKAEIAISSAQLDETQKSCFGEGIQVFQVPCAQCRQGGEGDETAKGHGLRRRESSHCLFCCPALGGCHLFPLALTVRG